MIKDKKERGKGKNRGAELKKGEKIEIEKKQRDRRSGKKGKRS